MAEVIRLLQAEHASLAKFLTALEHQLDRFRQGEPTDYDIVQGVVDYCLAYPDLYHHPKEDLVYEKLRIRDEALADRIGDVVADHERLARLTRRFAAAVHNVLQEVDVSRDAFEQTANDFLYAYRSHMREEEEQLFPAALRALTEEDWREIDSKVTRPEDPLFGESGDRRFVRLRQEILAWDQTSATPEA